MQLHYIFVATRNKRRLCRYLYQQQHHRDSYVNKQLTCNFLLLLCSYVLLLLILLLCFYSNKKIAIRQQQSYKIDAIFLQLHKCSYKVATKLQCCYVVVWKQLHFLCTFVATYVVTRQIVMQLRETYIVATIKSSQCGIPRTAVRGFRCRYLDRFCGLRMLHVRISKYALHT